MILYYFELMEILTYLRVYICNNIIASIMHTIIASDMYRAYCLFTGTLKNI